MRASVTAVVLNWRTPALALEAARSLAADGIPPQQVVVLDNGSGDGSAQMLRERLAGFPVIALEQTVGFAAANNLACRMHPAEEAYLLVNGDARVRAPGSVPRLLEALRMPGVGIAVPRLRNGDGTLQPSVYPLSSPLSELIRAAGLSRLVPQGARPRLSGRWAHDRSRTIECAIGAVLAIRAQAWTALGGLDERRALYAEDLDLFWRARRLGWLARFVAEAEFTHLGGASSSQRWDRAGRAQRVAAAEAEMLRTHLGPVRAGTTIGVMRGGARLRLLAARIGGRRAAAAEQRALLHGYRARRR
jgi:N-acetylglucosaminyl-diphospho-decaprenol L-rhamnosyltransferase